MTNSDSRHSTIRTLDSDSRIGIISSATESKIIVCNLPFENQLCTYQCYPGGRGADGRGDFDIMSKIFVKNHSPGTTYFVKKKHKNPHPRAGELCQMFLPRGKLLILSIHRDQTRQKNCTSLSLRKTEIILPINSTKSNSHKY